MPETEAVAMQREAPRMNEAQRLFGVFWAPGAAFADIVRGPRWWVPMLLLMASAVCYTYLISQRIGWEQVIREGMAASEQVQNMPAAERERIIETQSKFAGIMAYAGAALGTPISMLAIAGLLMLFFTVFLGGRAVFRQVFGMVAYAQLPGLISMGVMAAVMHLKPPEDFDLQNPIGLNIGFYLPPESVPKWLISIGNSIDLMSFWVIALLAIGLRAVDPKATRGKAFAAVLLPWGLYVLGKAAFAAIRG